MEMSKGSRIGSLTMCKGIALLKMDEESSLGNLNWVTGYPIGKTDFFVDDTGRIPELLIGCHAAVTNRHFIDCTNSIRIGNYTTFAGVRSQLLTHSIDLFQCKQASKPIVIGEYCFVGTGSILLGGSVLPNYCVLGASSILNKAFTDTHHLYAGNPARVVKALPKDLAYFHRTKGFVY